MVHTFETETPAEAAKIAERMGYMIGRVSAEPIAGLPILARRSVWPWVGAGFGLGVVTAITAGLVAGFSLHEKQAPASPVTPIVQQPVAERKPKENPVPAPRVAEAQQVVQEPVRIQAAQDTPTVAEKAPPEPKEPQWNDIWPTLVFPARPSKPLGNVAAKHDEYKDQTSWELALKADGVKHNVVFYNTHPGKPDYPDVPPEAIQISVYLPYSDVGKELNFIVDGDRVAPKYKGGGGNWAYYELKTTDLLRMANAQKVRARVDGEAFILSFNQIQDLRELASYLKK